MQEDIKFYLVIPVGFESLALEELHYWWPLLQRSAVLPFPLVDKSKGGLEFSCDKNIGLFLNCVLKIPSRILLRLEFFTSKKFPHFAEQITQINWRRFWKKPPTIKVNVSSHGSALYTKKRIEESFRQGWREHWQGENQVEGEQSIFVRIVDDKVTVSLDTSGEHLHRRGQRAYVGTAPLRENLAAALLWAMIKEKGFSGMGETFLVDPMAGAGTFMLEAHDLFKLKSSRHYSFQKWCQKFDLMEEDLYWQQEAFKGYELWDVDNQMLSVIEENAQRVSKNVYQLCCKDVFQEKIRAVDEAKKWVIINPPYGERIKIKGSLFEYYSRLCSQIDNLWGAEMAGIILPRRVSVKKLELPLNWKHKKSLFFDNGGISVGFHIFLRTNSLQ